MPNVVRGYTIIAYPESMPEDWEDRLDVLPFGYCSALHDKDITVDENGVITQKKAHMHFFFQGNVKAKQEEYIMDSLGVLFQGQKVRSISGIYDYLTHEDKPLKYHYSRDIIKKSVKWCQEAFEDAYTPKVNYAMMINRLVMERDITEYVDLIQECLEIGDEELIKEAKNLWVMRFIDSRRNKYISGKTDKVGNVSDKV